MAVDYLKVSRISSLAQHLQKENRYMKKKKNLMRRYIFVGLVWFIRIFMNGQISHIK